MTINTNINLLRRGFQHQNLFASLKYRRTYQSHLGLPAIKSDQTRSQSPISSKPIPRKTSTQPLLPTCLRYNSRDPSTTKPSRFKPKEPVPLFASYTRVQDLAITLQGGYTSWTAVVVICSITAALLYETLSTKRKSKPVHDVISVSSASHKSVVGSSEDYSKMTGEEQPGRPGTLTAEEEEKLREFWVAVLQVFGVLDGKDLNGSGQVTPAPSDPTVSAKKTKKKRIGLFRKKDNDDADSIASEASSHNIGDAEDKYGQTKAFHDALANQSPGHLRDTFWSMVKHDHPDALLLRFLRARKWNVENALVMMVSTMRWRSIEMHVDDDIMKNGELAALEDSQGNDPAKKKLGEDFLQQMRMGKSFLHGQDKDDRPVTLVRARLHRQGEQSEESLERYTVFLIESARMILNPPVDTACIIFDMTGFSMANMDYAPVKFMIKCFEANYPESLGVVLVHKAPWIFQGIWKIIRGWLDPVVASKIQFTSNNTELEALIPRSRILRELDGDDDWSYEYMEPVPGENDRMKDIQTRDKLIKERGAIVSEYERVVLEWIHGEGQLDDARKRRHEVAAKLRADYWILDPYIRARSYYDRIGLIKDGGKVDFYPSTSTKEPPVPTPQSGALHSADDVD